MTAAALEFEDRARGSAALWVLAAGVVLAAHAGAVLWAQREPPSAAAEAAAPAAIMIELAPEPVAPEAPVEEFAPDMMDAPEILTPPTDNPLPEEATAPPPETEFTPDLAELMPVPEVPDILPPVEAPPTPMAEVTASRPAARPAPSPPPPPEVAERAPVKKPPPAPSRAATRAKVDAPPAPVAAASRNSQGSAGSASPAKWQSRLLAHIERRKRYPPGARGRREEGMVYVRFRVDGDGNVLSAQLARSSGYAELDAAVVALVRSVSPVPPPPPDAPRDITVPVQFRIK